MTEILIIMQKNSCSAYNLVYRSFRPVGWQELVHSRSTFAAVFSHRAAGSPETTKYGHYLADVSASVGAVQHFSSAY